MDRRRWVVSEIPDVRVGDVWADGDPRGGNRVFVERVCESNVDCHATHHEPHAHVVTHNPGGFCRRPRTIRLRRFRPTRNGYRLMSRGVGS